MKALTLTQPWATLVAIGAKKIATRSWSTRYRGPLAIHAAKGWKREDRDICRNPVFHRALCRGGYNNPESLPRGCVIAIAFLDDCRLIAPAYRVPWGIEFDPRYMAEEEYAFGDFEPGHWAWMLTGATPLIQPVEARGALGLWEWDTRVYDAESHQSESAVWLWWSA